MNAYRRAFTLVEVMIVIAIIGVLSALVIYGVRKYYEEEHHIVDYSTFEEMCKRACHPFAVVACLHDEKLVVCHSTEGKKVIDLK
jgi:prepilin-type N-terminal cleavage/methylation domain-containing protein